MYIIHAHVVSGKALYDEIGVGLRTVLGGPALRTSGALVTCVTTLRFCSAFDELIQDLNADHAVGSEQSLCRLGAPIIRAKA